MQLYLNTFKNNLLLTIAWVSGIATIAAIFLNNKINQWINGYEWHYLILIIILNLLIAAILSLPKRDLKLKLRTHVTANIFVDDIFKQDGIIVIPVNDFFDTLVDKDVVSKNTLHGKLINQFFSNTEELDEQINESLDKIQNIPFLIEENREKGKQKKYPLGTVARITKNNKIFYLVALTTFDDNHNASVSKSAYQEVLAKLFDFIEVNSQGDKVSLPLIGASGRSRLEISLQKKLECIILTILFRDSISLENGLNIILRESTLEKVNLNKLKNVVDVVI